MILYDLTCADGHRFDGWFASSGSFDNQCEARAVLCPHCGDHRVSKAPMAPRIAKRAAIAEGMAAELAKEMVKKADDGVAAETPPPVATPARNVPAAMADKLAALRQAVIENCDYVGGSFAEEARKIHYGEADPRGIYGEASGEEAAELREEGIAVAPLPWSRRVDA